MALYNCPRISFSVDFTDSQQQPIQLQNSYREAPVSSDFEFFGFSGSNDTSSMISADELFFKGRMLPLKDNHPEINRTTLREELLASDNEDNVSTTRPAVKGTGRWRERLGFKRSHKKGEKINNDDGGLRRIDEMVCEDVYGNFKGFGLRY